MKITIDEDVCNHYGLTLTEVLCLLLANRTENAIEEIKKLTHNGMLIEKEEDGKPVIKVLQHANYNLMGVLNESDQKLPQKEDIEKLAAKLRELFPAGMKTGNAMWRGNIRDLTLRLQKFFKLYGSQYTFDQIYDATKKYVESFNGNYTYMRTLKYFIMKSEVKFDEEGNRHIEDVSDLANFLENDCVREDNDDWLLELR